MTSNQYDILGEKLREVEVLLLSLENSYPKNDALHDAWIYVRKAMDKIRKDQFLRQGVVYFQENTSSYDHD